jgi:hypothetical protein
LECAAESEEDDSGREKRSEIEVQLSDSFQ